MSQASHGKLLFSEIAFRNLEDGVNPNFLCPLCRHSWQPRLSVGTDFPQVFDYNQKVEFTIPNHDDPRNGESCSASGEKIELFVALHKDVDGVKLLVQTSKEEGTDGIPENWWGNLE